MQRIEEAMPAGLHQLGLDGSRDGLLYVPASYRADRPAPLVLMLHGAGSTAHNGLAPFIRLADADGLLLLAPDSRLRTWDVILGGYGSDVTFLDRALAQTFKRCAVDPAHLAIEGFSDGASYALSLGLANGDLFTHIIAFSPGFMVPAGRNGMPHIYISHGRSDPVLSVDRCSRRIVPQLQSAGYDVHYHEFTGFHTVPQGIAREALRWFVPTKEKL
ncbi:MAG: phospholipase [Chloroflexi bacterium]|nr:MAG: phospholipase [Chloroflexota bacterium]